MIKDIVIFTILVVCIDSVYLKAVVPEFSKMITKIQGSPIKTNINAAIVVYIAMICVWYVFIWSEMKNKGIKESMIRAGILGVCIYAIFDFTNMAILNNYRLDLSIIDSIWGGVLFSLCTYLLHIVKGFI
jgi:uncharacterized membrane protein